MRGTGRILTCIHSLPLTLPVTSSSHTLQVIPSHTPDDTVDYFDELTTLQFSAIAANALIDFKDCFRARLRVKRDNDNYKLTLNCAIHKNKIYIN